MKEANPLGEALDAYRKKVEVAVWTDEELKATIKFLADFESQFLGLLKELRAEQKRRKEG